jgi:hypothetical protein
MVYTWRRRLRHNYPKVRFVGLFLLGVMLSSIITTVGVGAYGSHVGEVLTPQTRQLAALQASVITAKHTGSSVAPPAKGIVSAARTAGQSTAPVSGIIACTPLSAPTPGLANAQSPELRKLAQYQRACGAQSIDRISFFTSTPTTSSEAQADADAVAAELKEFAAFGVKPLVFMEPTNDNGNIDLNSYAAGAYDTALNAYYNDLQAAGVSSSMMGIWVYLPEGNLPVWSTDDPNTYASVVAKTIQLQKKYFPGSQASLLLDSESYPGNASWGNGSYISLLPYVRAIPAGLVDSFGLQGFPWAPAANQSGEAALYDPHAYLRTDFAAAAAAALGIKQIWFNTGTFHQMYTTDKAQTVTDSTAQRLAMLQGVIAQAESLKKQGFQVAVHIFAQNKAGTPEAIDWSYWSAQPGDAADTAVFTSFVHDSEGAGIPLWLFDAYGN